VGPMDQSADVLWIVIGDIFLESSRIHPTLLGQREKLPRTCHVYQVSHVGRTSISITTTLRYE
jgi:hypothetical protein